MADQEHRFETKQIHAGACVRGARSERVDAPKAARVYRLNKQRSIIRIALRSMTTDCITSTLARVVCIGPQLQRLVRLATKHLTRLGCARSRRTGQEIDPTTMARTVPIYCTTSFAFKSAKHGCLIKQQMSCHRTKCSPKRVLSFQ